MKIPKNTIAKQEDDLRTIIHSLFCATLKYKEKSLTVEQKDLVFKIVDNCQVTPTQATTYLNILKSRGQLDIDGDLIIYTLKEQEENDKLIGGN